MSLHPRVKPEKDDKKGVLLFGAAVSCATCNTESVVIPARYASGEQIMRGLFEEGWKLVKIKGVWVWVCDTCNFQQITALNEAAAAIKKAAKHFDH